MAEGVTAGQLLSKTILAHLECSICCTRYDQPKNLDCSHSFCLKCLQELKKTETLNNDKLTCPLCQKETILPLDGVAGLQNNYPLNAMVEEVHKQEQLLQGEESTVICQACDEENAAVSRCLNCEHYLCQECQKAHKRLASLKNHAIKTLAELQEVDDTGTESKMDISRCDIHPFQELCLYCMTCEQLICKVCTSHHGTPLHTCLDLENATNKSIQETINLVSQLDSSETNLTGILGLLVRRLNIMLNETKRHISEKAEHNISEIREMEKVLLQEASEAARRKGKTLAKLIFAQTTLNIVVSSNRDLNKIEILKNRQQNLHNYINIDERKTDLTHDLSFLSFKESKDNIGTLLLEESWGKSLKVDVSGKLIGAFSTGCLMVVSDNKDSVLTILNPDGKVSHTYGQSWFRGNLENPMSLAVNKDDLFIILDGPTVKTFGSFCQFLHQFTPGKESGSEPTCLAVDENNVIAVGYRDRGEVSLHNPDGSLIRTLSAPGIDKYMTMNNHRINYTSPTENAIMCVSLNEAKCETLFRYKDASPNGITCDEVGDIYVVYESRAKPDTHVSSLLPSEDSTPVTARGLLGQISVGRQQPNRVNASAVSSALMFGTPPKSHAFGSVPAASKQPYTGGGISFGGPCSQNLAVVQDDYHAEATQKAQPKQHFGISHFGFGADPTTIAQFTDAFYDVTYTPRGQLALVGGKHTIFYHRK